MLCLPGLTPVANDAHAVGDSGEWVVARSWRPPLGDERLHVRQLALVHPLPDQVGVHAVEPEDHELLREALRGSLRRGAAGQGNGQRRQDDDENGGA